MNVGDIWWVRFPGGAGHAPAGHRPAIVMQSASASAQVPTVLVVPLTTQLDAIHFPGTVLVEIDATNNLRQHSVAPVFQLTAVDRSFLDRSLGRVSPAMVQKLYDALDTLTERPA